MKKNTNARIIIFTIIIIILIIAALACHLSDWPKYCLSEFKIEITIIRDQHQHANSVFHILDILAITT
jgi:hypothetical protein